jgi:hypothetical protein
VWSSSFALRGEKTSFVLHSPSRPDEKGFFLALKARPDLKAVFIKAIGFSST